MARARAARATLVAGVRTQERIFAAIPADAKLGQAEDLDFARAGLLERGANARGIAIPIQRDLIQDSGTNGEQLHAGEGVGIGVRG